MPRLYVIVSILFILAILPSTTYAFGAGSIPGYSFLNDRAFRHGDIENILTSIAKSPHHHAGGSGGISDFLSTLWLKGLTAVLHGNAAQTFSKSDVRRIYFGNWLRDYSQAVDVAGLSKMTLDTLLIIIQALGFMSFGFTTREFHITPERLGVYLPVEHIDNPKGYASDAQKHDPRLRPPVDLEELEIDLSNGMKKYMATEGHTWDTSTAHIRRTLRTCIVLGRTVYGKSGRRESQDTDHEDNDDPDDREEAWEAFRLLGSALHTLEDLFAHSEANVLGCGVLIVSSVNLAGNWCELVLRKLGCTEVFCHVGDQVLIPTPNGLAPPLVTGTFGSADFIHSVLGEASDHLSQASIVDLTVHMEEAENTTSFSSLRDLLARLPDALNLGQKAAASEDLEKRYKAHHSGVETENKQENVLDLTEYAPSTETQEFLWDVLSWRDDLVRAILSGIESIPGLQELLEQLFDVINQCVYTLLAPILIPIAKEVTLALKEQSQEVIDTEEQYEVFDNPKASDPTHSILAKDHVDLVLNEPAGRVAKVVVEHTVTLVVSAWYDDERNLDNIINEILTAFFHPYFVSANSKIQNEMIGKMQSWLDEFLYDDKDVLLSSLTKEGVREGRNKRITSPESSTEDTMSSLTGSADEYDSAYESHRSVSDGYESMENEAPMEREQEVVQERITRARRGYKSVLRNPNASDAEKRDAFDMLKTLAHPERRREEGAIPSNNPDAANVEITGTIAGGEANGRRRRSHRRRRLYRNDDEEFLPSLSSDSDF